MTSHSERMDTENYWRSFPETVRFDEPCELVGRLMKREEFKAKDGYLPKITLQTKDGELLVIVVGQVRLLAELKRAKPAIGELIKITYHGEAKKAAPGMSPSKEFTVDVHRPNSDSGSGAGSPVRGSAGGPENGPGVGSKAT